MLPNLLTTGNLAAGFYAIIKASTGDPVFASIIWAVRKPHSYFDNGRWRLGSDGGPLLINLIHDVDLLRYCCGEVAAVHAVTDNRERGFAVEESGAITLQFASGATASVVFSDAAPSPWNWEGGAADTPFVPPTRENCYRFLGAKGSLEFPQLALWRHAEDIEDSWNEPIQKHDRRAEVGDALGEQLRHFIRVARGEAAPLCSAADAVESLAVIEAIQESARNGVTVALRG